MQELGLPGMLFLCGITEKESATPNLVDGIWHDCAPQPKNPVFRLDVTCELSM